MGQEMSAMELQLGKEKLQFVGLDKLQIMKDRWDEKRHSNAQYELHLILEGTCQVDLEDRSCSLRAGHAILIPPGQYHRPAANPGPFERLSLAFFVREGAIARKLSDLCRQSLVLETEQPLQQLARDILREHCSRHAFRTVCLEAMLTRFAVEFLRLLDVTEEETARPNRDSGEITAVIDAYFEAHFADGAGEAALAERLHISRRQLVRVLQEHYGMNFRQKLIHARMDYAAWLLRTTHTPVSRICTAVGYNSEAAFFKTFRQHFGMTPNRYRAEKKSI